MNVMSEEFNWEMALEISKEEGFEDGFEEGRMGRDKELLNLLAQGYTPEDLVRELQGRAENPTL